MSLILDAIKKSERERNDAAEPSVQSIHSGYRPPSQPASRPMRWGMLLVATTIIGFGLWWFWPALNVNLDLQRPGTDRESPVTAAPAEPVTPLQEARGADQTVIYSPEPRNSASTSGLYSEDAELPPRHEIREFWELPADYQARVPEMDFSFHVYSREPHKRTIIINGRQVREGQMVASGLKLRMITETGVILYFEGRFFFVDVIEKW